MKAIRYQIQVHNSLLEFNHNLGRTISEVYVPELGLAFNQEACFLADEERLKHSQSQTEVELTPAEVVNCKQLLQKLQEQEKLKPQINQAHNALLDLMHPLARKLKAALASLPAGVRIHAIQEAHDEDEQITNFTILSKDPSEIDRVTKTFNVTPDFANRFFSTDSSLAGTLEVLLFENYGRYFNVTLAKDELLQLPSK